MANAESAKLVPAPESDISALTADAHQPGTWYAAGNSQLFRSTDNGDGWKSIGGFNDEESEITVINGNKNKAGMLALVSVSPDRESGLYVSEDGGENWQTMIRLAFTVNDVCWAERDGTPILMLACDAGLFELLLQPGAVPVQVLVDPDKPGLGFYAVTVSGSHVAVAARGLAGVYFSAHGGRNEPFLNIGLQKEDMRVLKFQHTDTRTYLWAGIIVTGNEPGKGCVRWELQGSDSMPAATPLQKGWRGGSCWDLAFKGDRAFAASHDGGVLWLDTSEGESAAWQHPGFESGLPLRDDQHSFYPVKSVAANFEGSGVMAAGERGIYRSDDDGLTYKKVPGAN